MRISPSSSEVPDVAVVIPLYNGARWIGETLQTVLKQTLQPSEIVLVDDGSTDGSMELIRHDFPELTLIENPIEGPGGAGAPRNYGLQNTTAPLIAFLDQDDLWHPEHLATAVALMEPASTIAAFTGMNSFMPGERPSFTDGELLAEPFSFWDHFPANTIHSPSCGIVRRSALEVIGGWPSEYSLSDLHAWLLLAAEGPMVRTHRVTVGKRTHPGSALHTLQAERTLAFAQEYLTICRATLPQPDRTHIDPAQLRNRLDAFEAALGVLEGALRGDRAFLTESARTLDLLCSSGPEASLSVWQLVFWMLGHNFTHAPIEQQLLLLKRILDYWPPVELHLTRALARTLTRNISYRSFVRYALRHPYKASTSALYQQCMVRQIEKVAS